MGSAYLGTGYSLLIVGLLHASFNASASTKLDVFDGDWQQIAAVIVLLGVVAAVSASRSSRTSRTSRSKPSSAEGDPDVRTCQHPAERRRANPTEERDGPQSAG